MENDIKTLDLNKMKNHLSFSIISEMKCILLILVCGFASEILALRCITSDGLQVEEVRRVVKKCMRKVTSSDDVRGYDEYENFESADYEMKDVHNGGRNRDNNNDRMNVNNNYNPRFNQYDERSTQTGGNYYEMNRPRNNRHDPWAQQQQQPQYNPYQMHGSGHNNYFGSNQERGDFYNGRAHQNKNINNDNATDKHERDRACILQCFFQELKMVMSCVFSFTILVSISIHFMGNLFFVFMPLWLLMNGK